MGEFLIIGLWTLGMWLGAFGATVFSTWIFKRLHRVTGCTWVSRASFILTDLLLMVACGYLAFANPSFPAALWMMVWWSIFAVDLDSELRLHGTRAQEIK